LITIPAQPAYVQVIRLIAAGLAARLSFTIEDIEDLKIGVDELTAYLTGTQGREGTLEVKFGVADERIEISGAGRFTAEYKVRTDLTDFSRMILETVADSASLEHRNGTPTFNLVKSKHA
jgi:serine/threonine-protein kinase RsbW